MQNKLNNISQSGFKVPKNYFETFETNLKNQVKLKEKVSSTGFTVPQEYFNNFQVSVTKEKKVISIFNRKNLLYVSSIAAILVLFFSIFPLNPNHLSYDALEMETVENYILNNVETNDIAALFSSTELNESAFLDYNINDETLNYYLDSLDETDFILE